MVYFLLRSDSPPALPPEPSPTPFQPVTNTLAVDVIPTSTQEPTPTEIPIPFEVALSSGNPMKVEIKGSSVLERFSKQGIFLKDLYVTDCNGCTFKEIDRMLGSATISKWIAVRDYVGDTTILYVHSSWHTQHGPYLGEIFRRIAREEDLKGKQLCLNEVCFLITASKTLESNQVMGAIPVSSIFDPQANQVIIVTCDSYSIPGIQTPKMLIQLIPR